MMKKFLEMLQGQVRAGRKLEGTTLSIAGIDGYLLIKKVNLNKKGLLESIVAMRDDEDENPITITTDNQEIAHYVCNPNPKVALSQESVSVTNDGSLCWKTADGLEFSTKVGSYKVDRVLGAFKGKIYLALESDPSFTTNQVAIYDVQSDTFEERKLVVSKTAKMFVLSDDEAYIVNTSFEKKKIDETTDGQPVIENCCTFNQIVTLTSDGMGVINYYLPDDNFICSEIKKSADGRATLFVIDKMSEGKNHVVLELKNLMVIASTPANEVLFTVPTLNADEVEIFVGGKYNDIVTVKTSGFMQVESTNGNTLLKTEDATVVKAMDGFNIFCEQSKVYAEDGSYSSKITYADKAYAKIQSVIVKNTDRGDVITIA